MSKKILVWLKYSGFVVQNNPERKTKLSPGKKKPKNKPVSRKDHKQQQSEPAVRKNALGVCKVFKKFPGCFHRSKCRKMKGVNFFIAPAQPKKKSPHLRGPS
jgi:hypothetical protein